MSEELASQAQSRSSSLFKNIKFDVLSEYVLVGTLALYLLTCGVLVGYWYRTQKAVSSQELRTELQHPSPSTTPKEEPLSGN